MQQASLIKWKKGGLKSPMARALGLGNGHGALHHWVVQRVTGILSVPLALWLVYSFLCVGGMSYADVALWLAKPWNAVLMILTVITFTHHAALGMQMIIEDYVHGAAAKIISLIAMKAALILVCTTSVFAVLKVAL